MGGGLLVYTGATTAANRPQVSNRGFSSAQRRDSRAPCWERRKCSGASGRRFPHFRSALPTLPVGAFNNSLTLTFGRGSVEPDPWNSCGRLRR